jgi:hypothetical protein
MDTILKAIDGLGTENCVGGRIVRSRVVVSGDVPFVGDLILKVDGQHQEA